MSVWDGSPLRQASDTRGLDPRPSPRPAAVRKAAPQGRG